MSNTKGLHIHKLNVFYDKQKILHNINLHLPHKKTIAIIGKSGCGKSTLLNVIANVYKNKHTHVSGHITYDGKPLHCGQSHFMQQNDLLLSHLKIIDNIALPLRIQGITKHNAQKKALSLLKKFSLSKVAHFYPSQLSGGMRQRIALMRACISIGNSNSHPLLLLDEPFARLDAITKQECEQWCSAVWKSFNSSVVLITHDIQEALRLADYVGVLSCKKKNYNHPTEITFLKDISKLSKDISKDILQYLV